MSTANEMRFPRPFNMLAQLLSAFIAVVMLAGGAHAQDLRKPGQGTEVRLRIFTDQNLYEWRRKKNFSERGDARFASAQADREFLTLLRKTLDTHDKVHTFGARSCDGPEPSDDSIGRHLIDRYYEGVMWTSEGGREFNYKDTYQVWIRLCSFPRTQLKGELELDFVSMEGPLPFDDAEGISASQQQELFRKATARYSGHPDKRIAMREPFQSLPPEQAIGRGGAMYQTNFDARVSLKRKFAWEFSWIGSTREGHFIMFFYVERTRDGADAVSAVKGTEAKAPPAVASPRQDLQARSATITLSRNNDHENWIRKQEELRLEMRQKEVNEAIEIARARTAQDLRNQNWRQFREESRTKICQHPDLVNDCFCLPPGSRVKTCRR